MGSSAIAISLPFSCILGLLASMTSTTMGMSFDSLVRKSKQLSYLLLRILTCSAVRKKYAWVYAIAQFVMVVLFAHLFYSLVRRSSSEIGVLS